MSTAISDFLFNTDDNPAYQQGQQQLNNIDWFAGQASNAFNNFGNAPQQQVAAFDPLRQQGIQNQIGAAQGAGQNLANAGAGTLSSVAGGVGAGQNALQGIAGGLMGPQFNTGVANDYQQFMNPQLMGAQQALQNQANMAWNKGAANVGGAGGGFLSSGRNAAMGQAQENAAATLGANQQQLAFNAAQQAAQAGQQSGLAGFQGQYSAANSLGNQALQGAQLTSNMQNAQLMPGQLQEAGGMAYQQQQQNMNNAAYQNALAQQQNQYKNLGFYSGSMGAMSPASQARDFSMPNDIMAIMNMLGQAGGTSGYGLLSGLLGKGVDYIGNQIFGPSGGK